MLFSSISRSRSLNKSRYYRGVVSLSSLKIKLFGGITRMIQTFIFFDLETTGLILPRNMPKITEISLIAVTKDNICNSKHDLPRVLHKLIIPINPKREIDPTVEKLTGLSDENLNRIQFFNVETYNLMMNFIQQLPGQVCFVAYNGNKFDYPILSWELKNINRIFSEDILCIDLMVTMKKFFSSQENTTCQTDSTKSTFSTSCMAADDILLDDGNDEMLCEAYDKYTSLQSDCSTAEKILNPKETVTKPSCSSNVESTPVNYYEKRQKSNEKTPKGQIIPSKKIRNLQNENGSSIRKKLDYGDSKEKVPCNYKLATVYKHICNRDHENAHTAEADCLAMIRIAVKIQDFFLQWADENAVPLIKDRAL